MHWQSDHDEFPPSSLLRSIALSITSPHTSQNNNLWASEIANGDISPIFRHRSRVYDFKVCRCRRDTYNQCKVETGVEFSEWWIAMVNMWMLAFGAILTIAIFVRGLENFKHHAMWTQIKEVFHDWSDPNPVVLVYKYMCMIHLSSSDHWRSMHVCSRSCLARLCLFSQQAWLSVRRTCLLCTAAATDLLGLLNVKQCTPSCRLNPLCGSLNPDSYSVHLSKSFLKHRS